MQCSKHSERGCLCVQNVWQEVLRCVSRWELLQQIASGGPTDALLFAAPAEPVAAVKRRNFFSRGPREGGSRLILHRPLNYFPPCIPPTYQCRRGPLAKAYHA